MMHRIGKILNHTEGLGTNFPSCLEYVLKNIFGGYVPQVRVNNTDVQPG